MSSSSSSSSSSSLGSIPGHGQLPLCQRAIRVQKIDLEDAARVVSDGSEGEIDSPGDTENGGRLSDQSFDPKNATVHDFIDAEAREASVKSKKAPTCKTCGTFGHRSGAKTCPFYSKKGEGEASERLSRKDNFLKDQSLSKGNLVQPGTEKERPIIRPPSIKAKPISVLVKVHPAAGKDLGLMRETLMKDQAEEQKGTPREESEGQPGLPKLKVTVESSRLAPVREGTSAAMLVKLLESLQSSVESSAAAHEAMAKSQHQLAASLDQILPPVLTGGNAEALRKRRKQKQKRTPSSSSDTDSSSGTSASSHHRTKKGGKKNRKH
ncbi:hypothetical protein niasHT_001302 [Heterodera trifolii]|uniref:Zinc knuckle domain-containing protein n=1 Tax=Heterodera trifolii TaxID=157864 RepID=A0ABD2M7R7_9BILA